jgi:cell division protein ZipA
MEEPQYFSEPEEIASSEPVMDSAPIQVLYVMAKQKASFAGYELLQVLLAVGLRFGQMNIFHYYRQSDIQEEALFSLVSATEPGTFDIRNMGGFSCVGLTLFMKKTGDAQEDQTRFNLMLQTANHLAEDLDGILLNARKEPLVQQSQQPSSRVSELAEAALILEE